MEIKKKPRDLNQLAASIVDASTGGDSREQPKLESEKDPAAVALGRKGGKKGGKVRAEKLTSEERSRIARIAARARWEKEEN